MTELLRKYFGLLAAGLLIARLVTIYALMALFIPIQTDITFPEGALVARAMDVAQGRSPYHDWRQWPHAFAPYPPLAYYPAGWIARAAGAAHTPFHVYMIGRSISLAGLVGLAVMLYLLGRRMGLSPVWSLIGVSLVGQWQMLMEYCLSYRPDAPKTFFAFLALWLASKGTRGQGPGASEGKTHNSQPTTHNPQLTTIIFSLGCLIVSAWFKPTAWGIGALLMIWVWRRLGWKKGLAVTAGFVAAGAGPILLLDYRWNGLLRLNIVDSLKNGLSLDGFRQNITLAYLPAAVIAAAGCAVAVKGLVGKAGGREKLIFGAAVASVLAGAAQMFKVGSDVNYFLDGYPLAGMALAWGVARVWSGEVRWPAWARVAAIFVLAVPVLGLAALDLSVIEQPFKVCFQLWREPAIHHLARRTPEPILATNPFIQLAHPDEPAVMDYFQYGVLAGRGKIDKTELLRRVKGREFKAVIISEPILNMGREGANQEGKLYCPEFLPALEAGYREARKVAIFYMYVPK